MSYNLGGKLKPGRKHIEVFFKNMYRNYGNREHGKGEHRVLREDTTKGKGETQTKYTQGNEARGRQVEKAGGKHNRNKSKIMRQGKVNSIQGM